MGRRLLLLLPLLMLMLMLLLTIVVVIQSIHRPNHFVNGQVDAFRETRPAVALPGRQQVVLEQEALPEQSLADGQPMFFLLLVETGPDSNVVVVVLVVVVGVCCGRCRELLERSYRRRAGRSGFARCGIVIVIVIVFVIVVDVDATR